MTDKNLHRDETYTHGQIVWIVTDTDTAKNASEKCYPICCSVCTEGVLRSTLGPWKSQWGLTFSIIYIAF